MAKLLDRVAAHAVRGEEADVTLEQLALGRTPVLDAQRPEEEQRDVPCRRPDRHRLPVEHRHRAPIPTCVEEHVVQMEVGVDQRLLSCVQRTGNVGEPRPKPLEDVGDTGRQPVAVPLDESVDLPRVPLLRAPWILARNRKSACQRARPPTTARGRAPTDRSRAVRPRWSNRPGHRPAGRRSDPRAAGRRVAAPRPRPSSTASARTRLESRDRTDAHVRSARSSWRMSAGSRSWTRPPARHGVARRHGQLHDQRRRRLAEPPLRSEARHGRRDR